MADESNDNTQQVTQQVIRELLSQSIETAVRSAESTTAAAAALTGVEGELRELKSIYSADAKALGEKVSALTSEVGKLTDSSARYAKAQEDSAAWIKLVVSTALSPQVLPILITLLSSALGLGYLYTHTNGQLPTALQTGGASITEESVQP